jgi:DNA-directed RNA polymerase specialized sigma24 family protein
MESPGSISGWIDKLQAGEKEAVQPLWERYFPQLVKLARKKLLNSSRRTADEEDVALSAFDSFCRHAEQGHYPDLNDRNSLWRLLAVITIRKAAHLLRDDGRKKRGGGKLIKSSAPVCDRHSFEFDCVFSQEPNPAFVALMADECTSLLRKLRDDKLENVALWRMEGYTIEEIAQKMSVVPRSVKRKLRIIRDIWRKEADSN